MQDHEQAVLAQFDPKAHAYLTSTVHAAGPDLALASELVQHMPSRISMLDAGCGAGHLSFTLAAHFRQVLATDLSPSMLDIVRTTAARRQLPQIEVQQANVEMLSLPDASFDLVASRYSAHHWHDLPAALREMRRVMQPDGMLLMIDLMGDESPLVDTHLQALELLRDPSHVRDQAPSQWRRLLRQAGFEVLREAFWPTHLEFTSWIERMRTPAVSVAAIRHLQAGASREVRAGLALEADGSFVAQTGLFLARAAR